MYRETGGVFFWAGTFLAILSETARKSMKVALKRTAIATSTVACVALFSFSWSEQRGISLGVESAQGADQSTVGVARRHYRRTDRGYGMWAEAVAATTSPYWNYDDYYCYGVPYTGGTYHHSYPGGYCLRFNEVTGFYGRPTLFPRYYGGW
jgi:hypothetical protein